MNVEELRNHCISIKGASESFPFIDKSILVFKVMGKMFTYFSLNPKDGILKVNAKCDLQRSIELRELYEGITNGQHTKGSSWNSISIGTDVPDRLIKELINHSVEEVIKKLSKKKQQEYYNQ